MVSRLRLRISTRALSAGAGAVQQIADYILTQGDDIITTENGRLLLGENSDFISNDPLPAPDLNNTILLSQSGARLTSQAGELLTAEQFIVRDLPRQLASQSNEILLTQDGRFLIENLKVDILTTQSGEFLMGQNGDLLKA